MITSWSHSRIVDFEACKYRAWLKYDQKIPEPERELPEGKTEHANDRGTRIHGLAEDFVRKGGKLPLELKKFETEFTQLRRLHGQGVVSLEGDWGLDPEWVPTEWRTAWGRSKLDAFVFIDGHEAVAIDYKTGKKFGNELKHAEQLRLYAVIACSRYPQIEMIHTELWYLDVDDVTRQSMRRDQALRFKPGFHLRAEKLTTCTEFPPNPNKISCKWCRYGPKFDGPCTVGVSV